MPPCLGCDSRSELCHGSCTEYKTFKEELERVKAESANAAQLKNTPQNKS